MGYISYAVYIVIGFLDELYFYFMLTHIILIKYFFSCTIWVAKIMIAQDSLCVCFYHASTIYC